MDHSGKETKRKYLVQASSGGRLDLETDLFIYDVLAVAKFINEFTGISCGNPGSSANRVS